MRRELWLVRGAILVFLLGVVVLHLLPNPILRTTRGSFFPYDPRFNFLSEYVRTQYGALMELNFFSLAVAAGGLGRVFWRVGLRRESGSLMGAALFLVLLALFPTDLVDLRTDANTCDDPHRIEVCTTQGRVHNPLSTVVFGFLALAAVSLLTRRIPRWRMLGWWAVVCGVLALILVGVSLIYLRWIGYTERTWVGLMQRSLVLPALFWLWGVTLQLETGVTQKLRWKDYFK